MRLFVRSSLWLMYNNGDIVAGMMPGTAGNEMRSRALNSGVRLAELMAALSIGTDLGMGQPLESALCSCVVAMRLGEALNLDGDTLRDVYYLALLRYIGCNSDAAALAALMGDELALRHDFAAVDTGRPPEVLGLAMHYLRQASAGEPPYRMAALVARGLLTLPRVMNESFAGHCEVAQRLAGRLGLAASLIVCLGQLYERWDGKGRPRGLKGEEVAPAVLLVSLAQDAVVWARIGGLDAVVATVRKRSGGAYHPRMAERFCEAAPTILAGLANEPTWESVLALEPGGRDCLTDEEFDRSCEALADFADMKSPYTLGHSPGVAALAAAAGRRCGLVAADVTALRRAGLLHDIGRVGVSAGIWGKKEHSRSGSGSRSACTPTIQTASWPVPSRSGALEPWHRSITSGWTAPATTGPSRASRSRRQSAFWLPPMPIMP